MIAQAKGQVANAQRRIYTRLVPTLKIQFKGAKEATWIPVHQVQDDGKQLILKDEKGEVSGQIEKTEIAGWWLLKDADQFSF